MHAIGRRIVIAGVFVAIAHLSPALAQPMGPGPHQGPGSGPGMGQAQGGGPGFGRGINDPASYLASLKTELAISSSQEAAWTDYAETVQGVTSQMQAMRSGAYGAMNNATWQERRDMMNGMVASRGEAQRIVQEAARKLLTALTPAQQAKADRMLPGLIGPTR